MHAYIKTIIFIVFVIFGGDGIATSNDLYSLCKDLEGYYSNTNSSYNYVGEFNVDFYDSDFNEYAIGDTRINVPIINFSLYRKKQNKSPMSEIYTYTLIDNKSAIDNPNFISVILYNESFTSSKLEPYGYESNKYSSLNRVIVSLKNLNNNTCKTNFKDRYLALTYSNYRFYIKGSNSKYFYNNSMNVLVIVDSEIDNGSQTILLIYETENNDLIYFLINADVSYIEKLLALYGYFGSVEYKNKGRE